MSSLLCKASPESTPAAAKAEEAGRSALHEAALQQGAQGDAVRERKDGGLSTHL